MANYQVVSHADHAHMRWSKFTDYTHAGSEAIAPLVFQEFPAAARYLPLGFMEADGNYVPVAIQGLQPGRNLLVAADGRWLGGYVPAKYRSFPFTLANSEDGQQVLCVDAESGLLTSTSEGEALFDEDGQPSMATQKILAFLSAIAANRQTTESVCAVLRKHDVIQPWPIKIATKSGHLDVGGLFRIDENTFNTLPIDALDEIRKVGALPVVYLQLMSMQNLSLLGRLADMHASNESKLQSLPDTLDLEYLNDSGNISFGNL
jgi:hypothetical protein